MSNSKYKTTAQGQGGLSSEANAMNSEVSRLITFLNWPSESGPWPSALAHAGLYYEGNGDETRCFSCDGRIRNWESGVDAMEEHLRLYRHCPYVLGQDARNVAFDPPGNGGLGLPPQSTTQQQREQQQRPRTRRPPSSPPASDTVDLMNPARGRRTIGIPMGHGATNTLPTAHGMSGPPHSPSMCDSTRDPMLNEDARLLTFADNWPNGSPVQPEDLARAGFYFEGPGDRVKCPFCENRLQNWAEGDLPHVEHGRHFPDCSFVMGLDVSNVPRRTALDATLQVAGNQEVSALGTQRRSTSCTDSFSSSDGEYDSGTESSWVRDQLLSPPGRTAVEMGFPKKTVSAVLRQHGREFEDVGSLLDAIFAHNKCSDSESRSASPAANPNTTSDREAAAAAACGGATALDHTSVETFRRNEGGKAREENRRLKNEKLCKICLERDADIVLLPCSHMCSCSFCCPSLMQCPICRDTFLASVKVFLP